KARRIERVEHALQRRLRQRTYKIQGSLLKSANRFECLFRFLLRASECPDDAAHFFHVQMFRERRSRRHSEKSKEAIQIIGRSGNQLTLPFHYVGRFAQFVEHWAAINHVDWMELECERSDHTEISATPAKRPEQVGILIRVRLNKLAAGQHNIG